ncbi:hypothetical protein DFH08DRAFT_795635 [Mycena albidolilacea]|uniref:Myb/SANT-like domain-containing protein n=1 Tax=Mycena albidolilacea TaxID=1033008 RepID=A0AAD7ATB4_9AGAR|nr:hypothetical protein DFH08DRAFT_795635 [Mycena albidolilacea]
MLRGKSGWGWNEELKQIVVSDDVWDAYLLINPKIRPWRNKGFPLYHEMADLVDGGVATGERAFLPGQGPMHPTSSDWPDDLVLEDDDFPLDPVLRGAGGRVDPPLQGAAQPLIPSSPSRNSDMDDPIPTPSQTPATRKRVRAVSDSPPLSSKFSRGIAAALTADSSGPSEAERKSAAIKAIAVLPDFTRQEKSRIYCLIQADVGIADAFMAIPDSQGVGTRLTLAESREETHTGGLQAGNAPHVDIHELVIVEQGHCRGYHCGGRRKREGGHLFDACLSLASGFKLRWAAVGRGRCLSQKGSGAEAVSEAFLNSAISSTFFVELSIMPCLPRPHKIPIITQRVEPRQVHSHQRKGMRGREVAEQPLVQLKKW